MSILSNYREASGIIYTSGATSAPGDAPTQIRGCFEKLKAILEEAGSSFDNVLKVNVYLVNLDDRTPYLNPIWKEYFPTNPPARTTVQAGLGGEVTVEIEMVAAKK
jgi:enamine deaminase RidA (YjgF/YER057c/UK114 family)|tara:strand:- start:128 stop:445 length:318 start_codon:yes stop_codon:yes gene_type:complete